MGSRARPAGLLQLPARRPIAFLLFALLLTGLSGYGLTRLKTDTRVDLLQDPNSRSFTDQQTFIKAFGSDPIVVLVSPKPSKDLLTADHIVGLAQLEGKLASLSGVQKVYGPGTLVNTLAIAVTSRALKICGDAGTAAEADARNKAAAAGKSQADQDQAGAAAFQQAVRTCAENLRKQYPSLSVPALNNPAFIGEVLLQPGSRTVRPFWTWALPDVQHALINVRLKDGASIDQARAVITTIKSASSQAGLSDLEFTISGTPTLAVALADDVFRSLLLLLPLTLIAMFLVVAFALRSRLRFIAVPLSALAALWTAGVAGLIGLPVTPATLVVLPVVLGLATDYFIQALNRSGEEQGDVGRVAAWLLPATGIAALATAAGVLAFVVSPVPLVRQFGLFMAIGVVMAYVANLSVGLPLLRLLSRGTAVLPNRRLGKRLAAAGGLSFALAAVLLLFGLVGWATVPLVKPETSPAKLLPAGDAALADAGRVRRQVGIAGELSLAVTGGDVTTQPVLQWMDSSEQSLASSSGEDLKEVTGLSALLKGLAFSSSLPDQATVQAILSSIPEYFSGTVLDSGHHLARTVFGLRQITSVEQQKTLLTRMSSLPSPPPGYRAYPAGLPVTLVDALDRLEGDQLKLNLLALVLVLVVLALGYRNLRLTGLAVLPTAAAAGAASAFLFLSGSHSPITILLTGVIVAFGTEFAVLWLSRYQPERSHDSPAEVTSRAIGPAIVASALALVVGFAVLAISPVPTVRDFGLWSALDMLLASLAVIVLLPPIARRWLPPNF